MTRFTNTVGSGWRWLSSHLKALAATGLVAIAGVIFTSLFWATPAELWNRQIVVPVKRIVQGLRPNITEGEAFRIARLHVGSGVVKAIPFRNVDDPNQLIAVWGDALSRCLDTKCPHGSGSLQLTLLSGGPTYDKTETNVFSVEPYYPVGVERLPRFYPLYFDVIDRDSDGTYEVISFTEEAGMTSSYRDWFLTLLDTKTHNVAQLRFTVSRTDRTSPITGTDDPLLKSWLRERYEEFQANFWKTDCSRTESGNLTCQTQMTEVGSPFTAQDMNFEETDAQREALEKWVEDNGGNFTFGKIQLAFTPENFSSIPDEPTCRIEFDNRRLDIAFRGDIFLSDLKNKTATVLYVQDGKHHSSVQAVIVGQKYIWLGLAANKQLVAIDKNSMEAIPAEIPEWDKIVKTEDFFLPTETKDVQLDELRIFKGKLHFSDIRLTPHIDGDLVRDSEFSKAKTCGG
ncbi:hypothetical protein NOJ28_11415 [Neorhizobium galegae]|uniref:hypothetical protein n=1 Tax=Neorhizobium galegae TaxID=399 RepID=UPI00210408DF|nr:hypothetical protein [Neorhizobium galegae]MCQ1766144.1 hypothetical protein [Neorhizobium galegae]MCQ1845058.1 hypothetical protein [Neorhizobium galegae]